MHPPTKEENVIHPRRVVPAPSPLPGNWHSKVQSTSDTVALLRTPPRNEDSRVEFTPETIFSRDMAPLIRPLLISRQYSLGSEAPI